MKKLEEKRVAKGKYVIHKYGIDVIVGRFSVAETKMILVIAILLLLLLPLLVLTTILLLITVITIIIIIIIILLLVLLLISFWENRENRSRNNGSFSYVDNQIVMIQL